ncbi:Constitutive centromere-associated network cnp20 [Hyphodiscus hymeniophilus]|uniref:Constitutive centromere-associated network cnp20 n=1 Tax=Hyphodiscus hymeniophilus TaxID=353542 RepID=A0A9P6VLK1_9HELO|nr:Constitutive centromere-associated network cnp20 [Hyphodiscus hymeniophilus]
MPLRRSPVPGLQPNPTTNPTNEASIESPRITPRNSDGNEAIAAAAAKETPYGTLRQLANLPPKPSTPLRRASSAGPPSHRSLRRTPAGQARTPGAAQKLGGSARRPNVLTPHGRAAMRELESRRAGLTPAKDRRRSGRQQRETPRDVLRALSRVLAPTTQPILPTPQGAPPGGRFILPGNDDDDDAALERPRLSLALENEEEEDDSLLLPPRTAGLEDENFTIQSIEMPRRAISEQPPGRLSRGSFGSIRMSDQFADLSQGGVFESSFAVDGPLDDNDPDMDVGPREETLTLRDLGLDRGRISLASARDSDIRPLEFTGDDTENTFVFTVPHRELQEQQEELLLEDTPESRGRQSLDGPQDTPNLHEDDIGDWNEVDGMDVEYQDEVNDAAEPVSPSTSHNPVDVGLNFYDTTVQGLETSALEIHKALKKKKIKVSKHGIQYPSLPAGVIKNLATTYARTSGNSKAKIISDDLGAYARHAGRKTIDESDVITLMRRQRQVNAHTTPFSLAQRHLPRELLQELRMVPPAKLKKGKHLATVEEADED